MPSNIRSRRKWRTRRYSVSVARCFMRVPVMRSKNCLPASWGDHYRELAHHYRAAGVIAQAVKYLHLAGHQAVGRSAYEESIALLKSDLELARQLPEGGERATRESHHGAQP